MEMIYHLWSYNLWDMSETQQIMKLKCLLPGVEEYDFQLSVFSEVNPNVRLYMVDGLEMVIYVGLGILCMILNNILQYGAS